MKNTKVISRQAMIAAIYAVLSLVLSAISFGPVQVRISEGLTLLPVFAFSNVWGVTIGCFITNLVGFFTGANILGALDIFFGTLATFVAAILSYIFRNVRFKNLPILSVIPPILVNAIVIGMELCLLINNGEFSAVVFGAQALSVGIGQLLSCGIIGLIIVKTVDSNKKLKDFLSE